MRTIYEQCQYCGERAAYRDGDRIIVAHNCDKQPPGPPDPPRPYQANQVDFVRGNFSKEQLQQDYDELHEKYSKMSKTYTKMAGCLKGIREELDRCDKERSPGGAGAETEGKTP